MIERWAKADQALWRKLRADARAAITPLPEGILFASDVHPGAIAATYRHLEQVGYADAIALMESDFVEIAAPAFKCTCPSRKFPCKHGLALLLLNTSEGALFAATNAPPWVTDWLASRQQRAERPPPLARRILDGPATGGDARIVESLDHLGAVVVQLGVGEQAKRQLEGVGQLFVREIDRPIPGPEDLLVRVEACGICGTDLHLFHGNMDHRVHFPQVIGHESSAIIEAVGPGVTNWKVNDRVTVRPLDPCGQCPACQRGHSHAEQQQAEGQPAGQGRGVAKMQLQRRRQRLNLSRIS